jgi:hypothetical protein
MTDAETQYAATLAKLNARELKKKIAHLRRTYRRSLPDSTLARIGSYLQLALAEQAKRSAS